jgi:sigma-B regulation protein RsbU (phosphoserine phosphatase)
MDLAVEVQQSLLPCCSPVVNGLEIAGKSIYCDETGGDYYDFIQFPEMGANRIGIAVGDVVGHGIAAALLMTTVRASLRSRFTLPGSLSQVVADVNCLLCLDTCKTNSFMTLFFMLIDSEKRKMQWVRAGHDPAFVYNPHTDSFDELRGEGMALGVDASFAFQEYEYSSWADEQIILIGTDGIWETENSNGEIFGKDRLQEIIRRNRHCSSQQIMQAVIDALGSFRQTTPQRDDVTLVVVKVVSMGCG